MSGVEPTRRGFLGAGVIAGTLGCQAASAARASAAPEGPVMVGSQNALAGMKVAWESVTTETAPLDAAIEVVKVVEADPKDRSVGLGGLPNEDGVVQLDAATHRHGTAVRVVL